MDGSGDRFTDVVQLAIDAGQHLNRRPTAVPLAGVRLGMSSPVSGGDEGPIRMMTRPVITSTSWGISPSNSAAIGSSIVLTIREIGDWLTPNISEGAGPCRAGWGVDF
jgi:hypothetical protein